MTPSQSTGKRWTLWRWRSNPTYTQWVVANEVVPSDDEAEFCEVMPVSEHEEIVAKLEVDIRNHRANEDNAIDKLLEQSTRHERLREAASVLLDALDHDADLYLVGDAWNAYQRLRKVVPNV